MTRVIPNTVYDPAKTRAIRLIREWGKGKWAKVGMLQTLEWMAEKGIEKVGDKVRLDMLEMGVIGTFHVTAIENCPVLQSGPGRRIVTVFEHSPTEVYDLSIEGESKPIAVTPRHPFWSVDRKDWVAACKLLIGERVQAVGKTTVVTGWKYRGVEPVYNMEVEVEHCYRVGEQGILVHNASAPCDSANLDPMKPNLRDRMNVKTKQVKILPVGTPTTPVNAKVVEQTIAWVKYEPEKGSNAQPDAQAWAKEVGRPPLVFRSSRDFGGDDAGHVIAKELGGHGDLSSPLNIVPLHAATNTGLLWRAAEALAKNAAKRGGCVCVRVSFEYDLTSPYPGRPTWGIYEVWENGKQLTPLGGIRAENVLVYQRP